MFFVDYFPPVIFQIKSWSIPSIMVITHLLPLSTDEGSCMLPPRHAKPVRRIFLTCCSGWQHNTIGGKRYFPTSTCMSSQMPHDGLVWLWLIGKMGVSSLPPSKHGQFCSLETPGCGIFGIRTHNNICVGNTWERPVHSETGSADVLSVSHVLTSHFNSQNSTANEDWFRPRPPNTNEHPWSTRKIDIQIMAVFFWLIPRIQPQQHLTTHFIHLMLFLSFHWLIDSPQATIT